MTALCKDTMIDMLLRALENQELFPSAHSKRVAKYSLLIAQELQLFFDDIELLYQSALMHDVGERYSINGWEILNKIENYQEHSEIIKHMHERYDGSGYPDKLSKGNIPLLSRIISIANAYDNLTVNNEQNEKYSFDKALNEIYNHAGSKFDPILTPIAINSLKNVLV